MPAPWSALSLSLCLSVSLPTLGEGAVHDGASVQFLLRCTLAQREREREEDADDELLSQRCSLFSLLVDKWVLVGIGNGKLSHNRVTGLSPLQFFFEDIPQSVSSDIVDVNPCCELTIGSGGLSSRCVDPSDSFP